jgi:ABC-type polysaccharide/polyol phosphate export permease
VSIYAAPAPGKTGVLHTIAAYNPMTPLIATLRTVCLGGTIDWAGVGTAVATSVVVLVLGCLYFRRTEHTFADNI